MSVMSDLAVSPELEAALAVLPPDHGVVGTLRVVVELADGGTERWTLRFASDGVEVVGDEENDVEVTLPQAALGRLAAGEADDRVRLTGFDPTGLSRAIAAVPTTYLADVMAGGFRQAVLDEVFRRLPEFVIAEKAARVRVAVAFHVGGRTDGGTDRYVVSVVDGACTVTPDAPADAPVDATLLLEGHEFLRLVLGHLNPVRGVLSGQLRVEGQVLKALGFNSVMRIPGS